MTLKQIVLGLAFALTPGLAAAQQQCGPRTAVIERLSEDYGETRQSIGLAQGNRVIEVFASPDSGTWTITVTLPNGMTCLVAAGVAFEMVAAEAEPEGTPS